MQVMLDKGAKAPTRAHERDAALDLYAMHGGIVRAGQTATFHTGVHVKLPEGTAGILQPRSGLMVKTDILTFGLIDEPYRGEIMVHMFNLGSMDYLVNAGDRISQMIITPVLYEDVEVVDELSPSDRGAQGFGSTGV